MRFFKKILDAFTPVVAVYAVCLILLPWAPLRAQRTESGPVFSDDLSRRVDNIEKLNIERRLTVLETIEQDAKDNSLWYKLSSGGTGILLLEAIARFLERRKKEEED